jgi:crotonobetainyl-CoA:carnitine CoA-transferase CaiB-like acyl-CoA transferase
MRLPVTHTGADMPSLADLTTTSRLSEGHLPVLAALASELDLTAPDDAVIVGAGPLVRSPHRLAEAAAYGLLLEATGASSIWQLRKGKTASLHVELVDALHAIHSTHYLRQSGYSLSVGAEFVPTNGLYRCKDGRFIMIEAGPPYPKLERGYLDFFDCGNNRAALAREIANHDSEDLQETLSALGLPACVARTRQEWLGHPQGSVLAKTPLIEIEKLAEGPPRAFQREASFPLTGVRVLDMTHVLAGPRSTRSLAQYGADVLHISSPYHRDVVSQNLLVNMGKRSAYLLLTEEADLAQMHSLAAQADVFACSYRPAVARRFGLDPPSLAKKSDGLIYLSISAYGHDGPWKDRPGFDQNGQVASGFSVTEGGDEPPRFSAVFYLNDELTGYLAAAGMMAALLRRAREGGSYHVRLSLVRTAMWVQELGYADKRDYQNLPDKDEYPAKLQTIDTVYGPITELAREVESGGMPSLTLSHVRPFGAEPAIWR